MFHREAWREKNTMRSGDASPHPQESGRSPTKDFDPVEAHGSPRRHRNEVHGEHNAAVNMDNDVENTEEEEKLKVVVRVRPLQKNEAPWSTASGTWHEGDASEVSSSCKRRDDSGPSGSGGASMASVLSLHDKSVTWEKNGQIKTLLADAVFDGDATQCEVFQSVQDCIGGLLAGFDCSVFAYGQTGTGKTHTMSGLPHRTSRDDFEDANVGSFIMDENFGIVPRCIQRLFDQIDEHASKEGPGVTFSVYCSFVEIYNERIYDILSSDVGASTHQSAGLPSTHRQTHDTRAGWNRPQPSKEAPSLHIRQKLDGTVFVDGLTSRRISSRAEMLRAFREGSMNREVRDNLYNQHSSRGHSIFQVTLRTNVVDANVGVAKRPNGSTSPTRPPSTSSQTPSKPGTTKSRLSRLFLVDLAGSEKWHVNGSDLNDKYATELSSINKSLSALTNCVLALTQKERPHVPYRDSVLTRLLQSCLQGVGRTAFVVTISPARESLEESFATLRFAERLKALRCRPIRRKIFANEPVMGEQRVYYENQIHSMRMEVNRLRELLKKAHRRNQEISDNSAAAANAALLEENRRLKELLMHSERNRLVERGDRLSGKPTKGSLATATDPSPQRQAAKQIIASGQRPFSEEEAPSKSIAESDMHRSGHQVPALPSTPQPRPSQDRKEIHKDKTDGMLGSAEEKEYSTLVNRLQDKEARLNWMLEAELEAHNTRDNDLPILATAMRGTHDTVSGSDPVAPGKSVMTRSWAVERVLRKNLVVVPPPVRGSAQISPDGTALTVIESKDPGTLRARQQFVPPSSDADKFSPSPRQRAVVHPNAAASSPGAKLDSPRQPSSTTSAVRSTEVQIPQASGRGSQVPKAPNAQNYRPLQAAVRAPPPATVRSSNTQVTHDSQVKPASLLKLVGSETKGKSKDELVEDYKRARRAELEAMLRTMVHQ